MCHGSQKQTARHQVALPVLHIYRQKVRSFRSPGAASVIVLNGWVMSHMSPPPGVQAEEGPEGAAGGPSCLVHQGSHHSGQTLHQVPALN